jgi:hypothetical protein
MACVVTQRRSQNERPTRPPPPGKLRVVESDWPFFFRPCHQHNITGATCQPPQIHNRPCGLGHMADYGFIQKPATHGCGQFSIGRHVTTIPPGLQPPAPSKGKQPYVNSLFAEKPKEFPWESYFRFPQKTAVDFRGKDDAIFRRIIVNLSEGKIYNFSAILSRRFYVNRAARAKSSYVNGLSVDG